MAKVDYETETCSRCGGSGHYSYNQLTGTRCFKCDGAKITLTKRGWAAKQYMDELRAQPLAEVKVGDFIYWGQKGRCLVTAIDEPTPSGVKTLRNGEWIPQMHVVIHGRDGFKCGHGLNAVFRRPITDEMVEQVAAYQENLTKAGKPRKRPVKKGAA